LANPELGAKQICPNCQAKFYDLGRRPAVCPKCATAFDPEEAVKSRRMRARSTVPDYEADDEKPAPVKGDADAEGFEEEPDETPEIDEAAAEPVEADEEEGEGPVASPADDLGVDFAEDEAEAEAEEDDTVPFLEDEDDDFVDEEIEGIAEDDGDEH
jgi:uncharacterized protein (TIGR02300 family)